MTVAGAEQNTLAIRSLQPDITSQARGHGSIRHGYGEGLWHDKDAF
jgi:hypothetical protein